MQIFQVSGIRNSGSFDEHVQKGSVIDHGSPRGPPQNAPPSEFRMPADGTVTLRSGYIVSRIRLFIHFWVSVYTSQQPV